MNREWELLRWGDEVWFLGAELILWFLLGCATVILSFGIRELVLRVQGMVRLTFPRRLVEDHWGTDMTAERVYDEEIGQFFYRCSLERCGLLVGLDGFKAHLDRDHLSEGRFTFVSSFVPEPASPVPKDSSLSEDP